FHIGSQLLDISPIHEAAGIVAKLVRELKALQIDLKFFDIGGGLGVAYEKDECEVDLYSYAQGVLAQLHGLDLTIGMEPGRYLVA
ncbi:diaminopimelate decarboxylase, partial [Campylobacter jejuni]